MLTFIGLILAALIIEHGLDRIAKAIAKKGE
jgi:hypothetical protein